MGLFDLFKNKNDEEEYVDLSLYENEDFEMVIDDVFADSFSKRVVIAGYINSGLVHVGDTVKIDAIDGIYETKVIGIEVFLKRLEYAFRGKRIGLVVENVDEKCINKRRYNYKIKL